MEKGWDIIFFWSGVGHSLYLSKGTVGAPVSSTLLRL